MLDGISVLLLGSIPYGWKEKKLNKTFCFICYMKLDGKIEVSWVSNQHEGC